MANLKLRAWDSIEERMYQVVGIDNKNCISITVEDEQGVQFTNPISRYNLSKYTGANDICNNEIYTYDIVQFNERIYTVTATVGNILMLLSEDKESNVTVTFKFAKETIKVIGNIFTTKESE